MWIFVWVRHTSSTQSLSKQTPPYFSLRAAQVKNFLRTEVGEKLVFLGNMGGPNEDAPETPRTSQHFRIDGLKVSPQLVPDYAEIRKSLGQPMQFLSSLGAATVEYLDNNFSLPVKFFPRVNSSTNHSQTPRYRLTLRKLYFQFLSHD